MLIFVPNIIYEQTFITMKYIYLLIAVVCLSSCGIKLPAPEARVFNLDYRYLDENGIFVTESPSVSFDYKAVSSIAVEVKGGYVTRDEADRILEDNNDLYYYPTSNRNKVYVGPIVRDAYDVLIEKMREIGANGIINIRIDQDRVMNGDVYVDRITISGMAIEKW